MDGDICFCSFVGAVAKVARQPKPTDPAKIADLTVLYDNFFVAKGLLKAAKSKFDSVRDIQLAVYDGDRHGPFEADGTTMQITPKSYEVIKTNLEKGLMDVKIKEMLYNDQGQKRTPVEFHKWLATTAADESADLTASAKKREIDALKAQAATSDDLALWTAYNTLNALKLKFASWTAGATVIVAWEILKNFDLKVIAGIIGAVVAVVIALYITVPMMIAKPGKKLVYIVLASGVGIYVYCNTGQISALALEYPIPAAVVLAASIGGGVYYNKGNAQVQGRGGNPNGENPAAAAMYEKCTRLIEAQSQPAQGGRIKKKNTKHNRKTNNKTKKKKYSIRKRRNKKNSRQTKKNRKVKSNRKKRSYRKK